ncbi:MAG: AbrB/MazE/SpoVT family DNA-binding domain-containing protein [Chloroflexota bacterium]|nr:AbrB/MazE/SpoVT family DNA-binding domain-containing protein [Chloroflexota bacterium]
MNTTRTQVVKIGNSRGIRIPKLMIDQVGLGSEVEIAVQKGQLIIRPVNTPRNGWDERFEAMAKESDDQLLDAPAPTKWDTTEWEWQ